MHRRTENRYLALLVIGVVMAAVISLLQWVGCVPDSVRNSSTAERHRDQ